MRKYLRVIVAYIAALTVFAGLLMSGCGNDGVVLTPSEILLAARLDLLRDETFIFPANSSEDGETVFLPLKKWDLIFAGQMKPGVRTGLAPYAASLLVPGAYDHILVYVGKDLRGYAYAVELNTEDIRLTGNEGVVVGGIRFVCLGKDFGEDPQPSGEQVLNRDLYGIRWARTFRPDDRQRLMAVDSVLIDRIRKDLLGDYPYQLEFRLRGTSFLSDRTLVLVDDGLANGAGCGDYWTSLYEDYAGVCIKNARETAQQITDYYLYDPTGRKAYIPAALNPFGTGEMPVASLFALGFHIVDDLPHRFSCDGTEEVGLVLPDAIFRSDSLEDIEPVSIIY